MGTEMMHSIERLAGSSQIKDLPAASRLYYNSFTVEHFSRELSYDEKKSEYDQEILQLHTADQPTTAL